MRTPKAKEITRGIYFLSTFISFEVLVVWFYLSSYASDNAPPDLFSFDRSRISRSFLGLESFARGAGWGRRCGFGW